jgi:hypothetical protein
MAPLSRLNVPTTHLVTFGVNDSYTTLIVYRRFYLFSFQFHVELVNGFTRYITIE